MSINTAGGYDVCVGMKLAKNGLKVGYCEKAAVFHDYRTSLIDFSRLSAIMLKVVGCWHISL